MIVSFPAGSFTSGRNADLGAYLFAQGVESQAEQDGQVVLRMALTDATVVLRKGDIQDQWTEFLKLPWLRVEVKSKSASETRRSSR